MIDSPKLLAALQRQVAGLLTDLTARAEVAGPVKDCVEAEYRAAREAGRTAHSQKEWRKELLVQGAVAWVLACVFVRFMEDNDLVDEVWLSGRGTRRDVARGRRQRYFEEHPHDTDREVLQQAFRAAARFPAVAGLFDETHNPLWRLPISGDAARELIALWDALDDTDADVRPLHDFTDTQRDTRFLGDLYQDLSEDAQKRFALKQTPVFVESFILDRTLTPAVAEYGLDVVKMIDPTCGSGHFLIGAFGRLFASWQDREPAVPAPELAQRALRAVHGVDLNPFAVAIAKFRLIVAALNACEIRRLVDAPGWDLRLACGDALLHGPREGQLSGLGVAVAAAGLEHHFLTEDAGLVETILTPGYHVVVGNPPYIVAKDKALNKAYRERYDSCKGAYSLAVPFMERFFQLARLPDGGGYVGKITANSFMKREFGSKLIEEFLPTVDLQLVIDSAIAHLPGHDGLPTAILVGRGRAPVTGAVRLIQGIRGEPGTPDDPARGEAWRAIVDQVAMPGTQSAYVSTAEVDRATLGHHPWTLKGGGASRLQDRLDTAATVRLSGLIEDAGRTTHTGLDPAFYVTSDVPARFGFSDQGVPLVIGEDVRDWRLTPEDHAYFPYNAEGQVVSPTTAALRFLWPRRTPLSARRDYDQSLEDRGLKWFEHSMFFPHRFVRPLGIPFAFNATHNHFVFDTGGKVFKQTAPVLKLPARATEDDHFALLGIVNSATACFWLHQVCQPKPGFEEAWQARYEHDGVKVARLPLPKSRPPGLACAIHRHAGARAAMFDNVAALLEDGGAALDSARTQDAHLFERMVCLQEECDWQVMAAFGLVSDDVVAQGTAAPPLRLGERAFEIVLARQMRAGEIETSWFGKLGAVPIVEPRSDWPAEYCALVERRIELITSDADVGLIERPECKRRWAQPSWSDREQAALRIWLLATLEAIPLWHQHELLTCAQLSDAVRDDSRVRIAAQRLAGSVDADLGRLVQELVVAEAVPYLAAHRYKAKGLATRAEWEHVWDLQRQEDAIDALGLAPDVAKHRKADEVGDIPVPPMYKQADFRKNNYWRLRGKLDVPKERFVLVPEGSRTGDPSPVVGWAGWDHATLAFALASRASLLRGQDGAGEERLIPLLAGILELLPWVGQWHPEPDPETGEVPARELEDFLTDELGALGRTRDDLRAWRPPPPTRGRKAK